MEVSFDVLVPEMMTLIDCLISFHFKCSDYEAMECRGMQINHVTAVDLKCRNSDTVLIASPFYMFRTFAVSESVIKSK